MVWRRVLVPSSTTLRELHGIVQVAMGWEGMHLYLFDVYAVQYGSFELHAANPDVPLERFDFRENSRFSYVYDMGGHWEHEIRIEAINPPPKKSCPICIGGTDAGYGACPPEDCGGPYVYMARRDETESYDAWRDMDIMTGFLEEIAAADAPDLPAGRQVSDFMNDDVEAAMERIVARKPFLESKFLRGGVNKRFQAGDHKELMHQQM